MWEAIKDYTYWNLTLSTNQSYLGRGVLMLKRPGVNFLIDITPEERDELFVAITEWQTAMAKVWQPDWWNYVQLGNATPQLHFHLIPRYREPREFAGVTFEDKLFGRNYSPPPQREVDEELNKKIATAIREQI